MIVLFASEKPHVIDEGVVVRALSSCRYSSHHVHMQVEHAQACTTGSDSKSADSAAYFRKRLAVRVVGRSVLKA